MKNILVCLMLVICSTAQASTRQVDTLTDNAVMQFAQVNKIEAGLRSQLLDRNGRIKNASFEVMLEIADNSAAEFVQAQLEKKLIPVVDGLWKVALTAKEIYYLSAFRDVSLIDNNGALGEPDGRSSSGPLHLN